MDCDCLPDLREYRKQPAASLVREAPESNIIAVVEAQRQTLLKNGQDQKVHGPRLDDCIERFSASRKEELGEKTAAGLSSLLDRLRAYCVTRGVHFMRMNWSVDLLEDFKVEGLPNSMAATSKAQVTARSDASSSEAHRRSWTEFAPAEKVRLHRATAEQKNPGYGCWKSISSLAGAEKLKGGRGGFASAP